MAATKTFQWTVLPVEMKRAVLSQFVRDAGDLWACARVNRDSYRLCLPFLFETVRLSSLQSLVGFLEAVPTGHYSLIRHLFISSGRPDELMECDSPQSATLQWTDPLVSLLSRCCCLETLSLSIRGSLCASTLLPAFAKLVEVKKFSLENAGQDDSEPISERLAVSLAFSLPRLEELSLTRITRSARHSPELHLSNVPIAQGDEDVPKHSILGDQLRLPQLFRLPSLKFLKIRDTHLGDPLWAGPTLDGSEQFTHCPLEVIDLGSCPHISPAANEIFAARILARVPTSITSCFLSTSLPSPDVSYSPSFTCSSGASSPGPISPLSDIPSMPKLQTIHLTPLVPTSAITTTLAQPALAGSPVHTLNCSFHPDDAADGCAALEAFLLERSRSASPPLCVIKPGRKRASSRLSLCTPCVESCTPIWEPLTEEPGSYDDDDKTVAETPSPISPISPSVLYPSLSKLTIDIPESPVTAVGMKMSARRMAAAKRRAEERRIAAQRLQALAKELGLELVLRGVDLSDAQAAVVPSVKPTARARANTTF